MLSRHEEYKTKKANASIESKETPRKKDEVGNQKKDKSGSSGDTVWNEELKKWVTTFIPRN